jgi:acid phosphatase type 7
MKGIWFFIALLPMPLLAEVSALYLSWYQDPTTHMTIQWHSDPDSENRLTWKSVDSDEWEETRSAHHALLASSIQVHHVTLSKLTPASEYEFRIGSDPTVYRFRTMPKKLDRPITFVVGGNVFESLKIFRRMSQTINMHDPDFIVFGGNIAHALKAQPFQVQSSKLRHWLSFLSEWKKSFVREDGRIVPFLIAPGDEDIQPDDYELFFSLFAFGQEQLYRSMDFGNYLTLFLLDTGHFHPIDGPQAYWLNQALKKSQKSLFRFAVYNESAYPSFDPYLGPTSKKIRTHWCPLFESFGLQAAFEHHNRSFKRTFPLKDGQINESGTVYLGDGCWGASPQKTQDQWYLAKKAKRTGVWLVKLTSEKATLKAIDRLNEKIDEIYLEIK